MGNTEFFCLSKFYLSPGCNYLENLFNPLIFNIKFFLVLFSFFSLNNKFIFQNKVYRGYKSDKEKIFNLSSSPKVIFYLN